MSDDYLECPCCGYAGALPDDYEQGTPLYEEGSGLRCGCAGGVSSDGEVAYVAVAEDEDCPRSAMCGGTVRGGEHGQGRGAGERLARR